MRTVRRTVRIIMSRTSSSYMSDIQAFTLRLVNQLSPTGGSFTMQDLIDYASTKGIKDAPLLRRDLVNFLTILVRCRACSKPNRRVYKYYCHWKPEGRERTTYRN